jgi:phenylpropionate dioxygenase-like ring-hydroxylating dioxygenase large terminal subunit
MGVAMRRYWLPALEAAELPHPDCDPKHVELLGEHFVAFRDTNGNVGVLDEHCCHRGASLLLGRVEECGIRCLYHGWKFAVDGTVLETPNVPDPKFKTRVKARAYPVREAGGLIWVYLGPAEQCPPFPEFPWFELPARYRVTAMHPVNANFVQIMEGLVDSSHVTILHANSLRRTTGSQLTFAQKVSRLQYEAAPRIEAEETEFGFHYAALRSEPQGSGTQARITAFVAPCTILNPNGDVATIVVPRNDEKSSFLHVFWDSVRPIGEEPQRSELLRFVGLDPETRQAMGIDPNSGVAPPSRHNRFYQNRNSMRSGESFTGMAGLIEEDLVVSVSPGPMRDRSREMLSSADLAVGLLYRVLLKCVRCAGSGDELPGTRFDARRTVGVEGVLQPGAGWRSLVPYHRAGRADAARA